MQCPTCGARFAAGSDLFRHARKKQHRFPICLLDGPELEPEPGPEPGPAAGTDGSDKTGDGWTMVEQSEATSEETGAEPPTATEPAAAPAIGRTAAEQCLSGGTSLSVADGDACDWAATAAQ